MNKYIVNIAPNGYFNTIPIALTVGMHPMALMLAIISQAEDYVHDVTIATDSRFRWISKNQEVVSIFIQEYWRTAPSDCLNMLMSLFKYLQRENLNLFYGFEISRDQLASYIDQATFDKLIPNDEPYRLFAPSVAHDYLEKCISHACADQPDLCKSLHFRIKQELREGPFIMPEEYREEAL